MSRVWRDATIEDDPVLEKNTKGSLSFAKSGKNTRTTQVFISLGDNSRLDAMGFSPFGRVVKGFPVVESLYSDYGEKLTRQQHKIVAEGNSYLTTNFPKLDFIEKATIVEE